MEWRVHKEEVSELFPVDELAIPRYAYLETIHIKSTAM
jgi:hypothetical protein